MLVTEYKSPINSHGPAVIRSPVFIWLRACWPSAESEFWCHVIEPETCMPSNLYMIPISGDEPCLIYLFTTKPHSLHMCAVVTRAVVRWWYHLPKELEKRNILHFIERANAKTTFFFWTTNFFWIHLDFLGFNSLKYHKNAEQSLLISLMKALRWQKKQENQYLDIPKDWANEFKSACIW